MNNNISKKDLKDYKDKVPATVMQWKAIGGEQGIYGIFQYAMKKYGNCGSWKNKDEESIDRYKSAMLRHLFRMLNSEKIDPESGYLHSAHLAWNALTVLQFEIEELEEK